MTTIRNPFSTHAKSRKAGPMHHKNEPRGGASNEMRDLIAEAVEDSPGFERGFGKGCKVCKLPTLYEEVFDAFYCPACDTWLSLVCGDATCTYCANRPLVPSGVAKC